MLLLVVVVLVVVLVVVTAELLSPHSSILVGPLPATENINCGLVPSKLARLKPPELGSVHQTVLAVKSRATPHGVSRGPEPVQMASSAVPAKLARLTSLAPVSA